MTTNVILSGYTLPLPSAYSETQGVCAARYMGLDSMVSVDTRTGATLTYSDVTVAWEDLTLSEMQTIRSAWHDLQDQPAVAFTDPLGNARSASLLPNGKSFDSIGYAGKRGSSNLFEALFRVSFQMRLTP